MTEADPETTFAERVLAWYDRHGRTGLPWQNPATPYRVWISEIMLQQTRVETVRAYFERFMERFPDVPTLAAAQPDEVLGLWSGLGYYARARNLHAAAQRMVAEHGGEVPADFDALVDLPGIGRSTAGAILSLAGGQPHAILDGNVKRVLARHIGLEEWPGRIRAQRILWNVAEARTPQARTAAYNQGMMDLGASVCLRRPLCDACPVAEDCQARHEGTTDRIPAPKPKRELPRRETVALVAAAPGRRRHPARAPAAEQGIWGGLWSLPEFDSEADLRAWLAARTGAEEVEALAPVDHGFTHFRLRIHPHRALVAHAETVADADAHDWYTPDSIPGGIPAPIRRLADSLLGGGAGLLA
ncbi:MAG: A/G-specific adenine glycosylase [Halofilum sp. (in: g-proteobacteria)]|nr:A/G-specific adenine glycosylase [Halofilum sp. (in: g-proteobacteria)]